MLWLTQDIPVIIPVILVIIPVIIPGTILALDLPCLLLSQEKVVAEDPAPEWPQGEEVDREDLACLLLSQDQDLALDSLDQGILDLACLLSQDKVVAEDPAPECRQEEEVDQEDSQDQDLAPDSLDQDQDLDFRDRDLALDSLDQDLAPECPQEEEVDPDSQDQDLALDSLDQGTLDLAPECRQEEDLAPDSQDPAPEVAAASVPNKLSDV